MEKPRLVSLQQRRGWGAVLVLSGVSGLWWAVGYDVPEKPRLEHLRQGSGIAAPGPLSGYEAGLLEAGRAS